VEITEQASKERGIAGLSCRRGYDPAAIGNERMSEKATISDQVGQ
jgi:hypothetical protein